MFELIFMIILGLVFLFVGWRIWKREQITLIHKNHYTKVSENNKKPYTEKIGKACILMGIGMMLTGIVDFMTKTAYGWILFGICFVWGIVIIFKAQKKYNKGLF